MRDLPDDRYAGDALVVNDTRVMPARLHGVRLRETGPAKIEILLHRRLDASRFAVLARPARKLAPSDALDFRRAFGAGGSARRKRRGRDRVLAFPAPRWTTPLLPAEKCHFRPYMRGKAQAGCSGP